MGKPHDEPEDAITRTGVLRAHFGDSYRFWIWVRGQFTPASIGIIVSVALAAGGYIMNLRERISAVTTRVVVLETRVIPVIDQNSNTKALQVEIDDTRDRVERLEGYWDNASAVASIPNDKLHKHHRKD